VSREEATISIAGESKLRKRSSPSRPLCKACASQVSPILKNVKPAGFHLKPGLLFKASLSAIFTAVAAAPDDDDKTMMMVVVVVVVVVSGNGDVD